MSAPLPRVSTDSLDLRPYGRDVVDDESTEAAVLRNYIAGSNSNDWNHRFQQLLARPDGAVGVREDKERSKQLRDLSREFAAASVKVCVRITEELYAPDDEKSIPSIVTSGVAGGVKYLHDGIFVKMASRDWKGIYGSDALSIKAASHELVSTMALLDLRIAGLHVPLMALVLFRGHAFLCQSVIPIDTMHSTTLVHGSCDGGLTLRNSNAAVEAKLKNVCARLNLEPHEVVSRDRSHVRMLYTAADVETHVGLDGRVYLLDTARAFPPAGPRKGDTASSSRYLWAHLRPELVRRFAQPLNPDAFSNFRGRDIGEIRRSNSRIDACSKWLESTVVPEFARFLDGSKKNQSLTSSSSGVDRIQSEVDQLDEGAALVSLMHSHGINVRYLLLLLSHVEHPDTRRSVLTEAAARVLKHGICDAWRQLRSVDARSYHSVAADWLRLAFGSGPDSTRFWCETAVAAMRSYFVLPLEGNALAWLFDGAPDVRTLLGPERMHVLLHRTLDKCGIELVPGSSGPTIGADDVARIVPRVKHLSRIAFEEGLCFSRMAESASRTDDALRLYTKAAKRYRECLQAKADDYRASFNLSLVLSKLAKLDSSEPRLRFNAAFDQCRRALRICEEDWRCSYLYGTALMDAAGSSGDYTADERTELLRLAKEQLELSVSLSRVERRFEPLYNLGNALLHLARVVGETEMLPLLRDAVRCFEDAVVCSPSNLHALSNLAVAQTKIARTVQAPEERARFFRAALRTYVAVATASPSAVKEQPQLLFDWANCLFRSARDLNGGAEAEECLRQAAFRYGRVLELSTQHREAWFNLGVTLESLAPTATDDMVPLVQQFLALAAIDPKRAETCKRRLLRSPNAKVAAAVSGGAAPPVRPDSSSPNEPSPPAEWRSGSDDNLAVEAAAAGPPGMRRRGNSFLSRGIRSLSKVFGRPLAQQQPVVEAALLNWATQPLVWCHPDTLLDKAGDVVLLDQSIALQDASIRLCQAAPDGQRFCARVVALDSVDRDALECQAQLAVRCTSPFLCRLRAVHVSATAPQTVLLLSDLASGGLLSFGMRIRGAAPNSVRAYIAQLISLLDALRSQPWRYRKLFGSSKLLLRGDGHLTVDVGCAAPSSSVVAAPPDGTSCSDDALLGWSVGVCIVELHTGKTPVRDPAAALVGAKLTGPLLDFASALLAPDARTRERAVRQWRSAAWFAGLDWARVDAGLPLEGLLEQLDAFGATGGVGAAAGNADIACNTFISPARSAGFRGDTLQ